MTREVSAHGVADPILVDARGETLLYPAMLPLDRRSREPGDDDLSPLSQAWLGSLIDDRTGYDRPGRPRGHTGRPRGTGKLDRLSVSRFLTLCQELAKDHQRRALHRPDVEDVCGHLAARLHLDELSPPTLYRYLRKDGLRLTAIFDSL